MLEVRKRFSRSWIVPPENALLLNSRRETKLPCAEMRVCSPSVCWCVP